MLTLQCSLRTIKEFQRKLDSLKLVEEPKFSSMVRNDSNDIVLIVG